jgi:hypothetical protein
MIRKLLPGVLVLLVAGCAGQTIASRAAIGEANWFVRLDTFTEARAVADLRFNHPAEFSDAELTAILSRVQTQERVGLLEQKPFPQPLFSPNEIRQMMPSLLKTLRSAKPTEWAVFYSALPGAMGQEITSGGLFVQHNQLHVVVANHHERIPSGSSSLTAIRANPLSPWGRKGVTLSFDPPRFVTGTQGTRMGGSAGAPASELVLDHSAFLAEASSPAAAPVAAVATVPPAPASVPQSAVILPPVMPPAAPPVAQPTTPQAITPLAVPRDAGGSTVNVMKEQMAGLQNEIERLRRRVEEQDEDIALLKTRLFELDALIKNPPRKKPTR